MHTLPPAPTGAATRLCVTRPATGLKFDASGAGASQGYTVTNPSASVLTAVMFRNTVDASLGHHRLGAGDLHL